MDSRQTSDAEPAICGLVGAYAVDALEPADQARFERHLDECEDCRRELGEFRELLADSTAAVAEPPPAQVRERVLEGIEQIRPLPPVGPPPTAPTPVVSGDGARADRFRRRRWLRPLAAAAAILVAFGAGIAGGLALERQTAVVAARQDEALTAPDSRILAVQLPGGGRGAFVVSRQQGQALFVGSDLPDPGAGRTYQLWTIDRAGRPIPDALVAGGNSRVVMNAPVDAGTTALAVTVEPAGGSRAPTTEPVVAAL